MLSVIGIGPGSQAMMTMEAVEALQAAEIVVGYKTYTHLVKAFTGDKQVIKTGMCKEIERCQAAIELAQMLSAAFGAVAQNTAQAHLSPSEAGLLCSLESVFCALFSVAFFGEVLTARMAVGFAFIFAAIVATQLGDKGGEAAAADPAADGSAGGESPASGKPAKRNRGRIAR